MASFQLTFATLNCTGTSSKSQRFNMVDTPLTDNKSHAVAMVKMTDTDDDSQSYYSFSSKDKLPATAITVDQLSDVLLSEKYQLKLESQFQVHVHTRKNDRGEKCFNIDIVLFVLIFVIASVYSLLIF